MKHLILVLCKICLFSFIAMFSYLSMDSIHNYAIHAFIETYGNFPSIQNVNLIKTHKFDRSYLWQSFHKWNRHTSMFVTKLARHNLFLYQVRNMVIIFNYSVSMYVAMAFAFVAHQYFCSSVFFPCSKYVSRGSSLQSR